MADYSRRYFLQTLLTIPLVACSKKAGIAVPTQDSILAHFNVPLAVENLDNNLKAECKRKAEAFYKSYISKSDFNEQFEKLELDQFKKDEIVFIDGMAVSHIMTGLILMARSQ